MSLKIVRLEEAADGTFGALLINTHVFCVTMEPPDLDNQRNISNIPPGKYICKRVVSPRFGETFEITGVPKRTHVLFHAGNLVTHTEGCVLLARKWGVLRVYSIEYRAILNSGDTFKAFMLKMKDVDKCELEIVEV